MMKFLIMLMISVFFIAGCGTSGNNTSGGPGEGVEEPVNGNPIEEPKEEEPAEEVSVDVDALLENLEATVKTNATAGEAVFTITLKNTGDEDVTLTFSSGQKYEIVVTDASGTEVYRYSIDKMFTMALQDVVLKAGEEITWTEIWDYKQTGERVPSGEYTATVEIIAYQINGADVAPGSIKTQEEITVPKENVAFRNIMVEGSGGEYKVTGEARVFEASFFYAVEDGHDYVIKETVFQANEGAPEWSQFEINLSIPSDKLPTNGTLTVQLFERSAKDGEIVNMYHAVLEQFQ